MRPRLATILVGRKRNEGIPKAPRRKGFGGRANRAGFGLCAVCAGAHTHESRGLRATTRPLLTPTLSALSKRAAPWLCGAAAAVSVGLQGARSRLPAAANAGTSCIPHICRARHPFGWARRSRSGAVVPERASDRVIAGARRESRPARIGCTERAPGPRVIGTPLRSCSGHGMESVDGRRDAGCLLHQVPRPGQAGRSPSRGRHICDIGRIRDCVP